MADYYVNKTGNNANDGTTRGQAKLTIAAGMALLSAADKLYVGAGVYAENLYVANSKNGTSLANFNVVKDFAIPGEVVVAPGAGTYGLDQAGDWWVWNGIRFEGTGLSQHCVRVYDNTGHAKNVYFNNCIMRKAITGKDNLFIHTGSAVLNNCIISESLNIGAQLQDSTGAAATFNNCVLSGNSSTGLSAGGGTNTATINNTVIIGSNTLYSGNVTGTPLTTNTLFVSYKQPKGYLCLSWDDGENLDYFKSIADQADGQGYGVKFTFFNTYLSGGIADYGSKLAALYNSGHEIAGHTYHHVNLTLLTGIDLYYDGAGTVATCAIASDTLTLTVDGTPTAFDISMSRSPAPYTRDTLITAINAVSGFHAAAHAGGYGTPWAYALADHTAEDVKVAAPGHNFLYDKQKLTDCEVSYIKTWTEGVIQPTYPAYTMTTMSCPQDATDADIQGYIRDNGYDGCRATEATVHYLPSVNMYNAFSTPATTVTTGADEATTRQNIRSLCEKVAAQGSITTVFIHGLGAITLEKWGWITDELGKAKAAGVCNIVPFGEMVAAIRSDGHEGSYNELTWTMTYTDTPAAPYFDYRCRPHSALLNAGADNDLLTDYTGKARPQGGAYDIGVHEHNACGAWFGG